MIANLGLGVLILSFVISLYTIGAGITGIRMKNAALVESARIAAIAVFPLLSAVLLCLVILLITGQFQYAAVFKVTDTSMPLYLKITALWGGQAGSLLFWSWLLSGFIFALAVKDWKKENELIPWAIIVAISILLFFLILVLFVENPFDRIWLLSDGTVSQALFQPANSLAAFPPNGMGLNPLLRHIGMVVHPPMLYLGFVAFVIPFSFAISALITRRTDDEWMKATRKWTLTAWVFLSIGLVLGSRWAYDVLGWGGYWGWDPVEIAAFMPWLSGTAYLHSVMIQEKRGIFKRWNVTLIIITFCLVIFGTFLTRSGILSSVHAFSQSSLGPLFFTFISIMFTISLVLLLIRWNLLSSPPGITSFFSRESFFLFNNLLFMAILLICLTGVLFPVLSEIVTGQKVTVGPPFYEKATGPLFAGLLLLMGIVPLTIWGGSTARNLKRTIWKPAIISLITPISLLAFGVHQWGAIVAIWLITVVVLITIYDYLKSVYVRAKNKQESFFVSLWNLSTGNRRRYGGYIIHLGIVMMALGIVGIEMFQTQTQGTIAKGESLQLAGYSITYKNLDSEKSKTMESTIASVNISRNGRPLGTVYPRQDYYIDSNQQVTIPGVRSTLVDDVYVLLVDWLPVSTGSATFKVFHNPLVKWFWLGSIVFVLGTLLALGPGGSSRKKIIVGEGL